MRRFVVVCMFWLLSTLQVSWTGAVWGADEAPPETKPASGLAIWDTGKPSAAALAPAALAARADWNAVPVEKTIDAFKGDAVVSNGRIIAVLRKQGAWLEVYGEKADGAVARMSLRLVTGTGEPAASLERAALIENTKGSICLEASFKTAKGAEVAGKFRIKRGDVAVQAEPGTGASKLRVECPGRFVVLPDFFADDINIDATKLPVASAELPSENFVLHMTGPSPQPLSPAAGERGRGEGGDAIIMCVFENRQQDVKITLTGEGEKRHITGSEIGFENKKVWIALLEASGIWHNRLLKADDTGKIIPLDWTMPFPARLACRFPARQ